MRPIEPILGPDAHERPSREAVAELWAKTQRQPIPDHDGETLRRFMILARAKARPR